MLKDRARLKSNLIGDKAFYKAVFAIIIPFIVQNTISSFVNLLDNLMVGQLDQTAFNGVGVANQLFFIFNICIFGSISGASIFGAQFYGAGDYENMRASARFKLYACVAVFVIGVVVFLAMDDVLLSLFLNDDTRPEEVALTLQRGKEYLAIMVLGLLPFAITQAYASTLREAGETMLPMVAGIVAVFVNMVGNYILIFGHFGAPELGVEGAAIATVAGRFVEMGIVMAKAHNVKRYPFMEGMYRTIRVPGKLVKRILIMGAPLFLNELLWSVGTSFVSQLYSYRGLDVVAATNISNTVSNLFTTAVFSMGNAAAVMVGQALGADEIPKARQTAWRLLSFSVFISLGAGILLAIASPFIPRLYNATDTARNLACQFLLVQCATMPFMAFAHTSYFTLRSGGKTIMTFMFDCMPLWLVNVPMCYALIHFTDLHITLVLFIVNMTNFLKCLFGFYMVKMGVWINNVTTQVTGE
ncbi:MAG: MATE family efflux transporter [Clostridia bacterium]|nr:MATE family efflux transporter [Clostridia bacterium]